VIYRIYKMSDTTKRLKELERKAKAGWKCYFTMVDELTETNARMREYITRNRELVQQLNNNETDIDLTYLKTQFVEMYNEMKKDTECPVCFSLLTKENISVPSCAHLLCKGCKDEIMTRDKKCPCCRKTFYG